MVLKPRHPGKVPDSTDLGYVISDRGSLASEQIRIPNSRIPNRLTVAWAVPDFHRTSICIRCQKTRHRRSAPNKYRRTAADEVNFDSPKANFVSRRQLFFSRQQLLMTRQHLFFSHQQLLMTRQQLFFSHQQLLMTRQQLFFSHQQLLMTRQHLFFSHQQLIPGRKI